MNLGGAFIVRPTTLVVEHEELTFRCAEERQCEFEAVYHLRRTPATHAEVIGAFYGIKTDQFATTANGVDARHPLTPSSFGPSTAPWASSIPQSPTTPRNRAGGLCPRRRCSCHRDAHVLRRMAPVSGTDGNAVGYMGLPPLETRHPWLGTHARVAGPIDTPTHCRARIRDWAGSRTSK